MKDWNIFIAFWALIGLAGCDQPSFDPEGTNIYGFWRYQSGIEVEGQDFAPALDPVVHLQLNEDGSLSGFTSRNMVGGDFSYDSLGVIDLNVNILTKVADTRWSTRFTQMLGEVDRYRLEGASLVLIDSGTNDEYTFLKMTPGICRPVVNGNRAFREVRSDDFDLLDVRVADRCLEVLIGYGGGCEDDIGIILVGGGDYAESLPPQLAVKIAVEDNDPCEAYLRRIYYFDLTELQYEGLDELQLNLEGWDEPILVRYE